MYKDRYEAAWAYTSAFETKSWVEKIPAIKFPKDWEVQIIPPFGGALCRFRVNGIVSVYLDGYDILGYYGEPYWEIYPYEDDVFRCGMNEIDNLIEAIQQSINGNKNENTNAKIT